MAILDSQLLYLAIETGLFARIGAMYSIAQILVG